MGGQRQGGNFPREMSCSWRRFSILTILLTSLLGLVLRTPMALPTAELARTTEIGAEHCYGCLDKGLLEIFHDGGAVVEQTPAIMGPQRGAERR